MVYIHIYLNAYMIDLVDVWHPQGVLTRKTYQYHQYILINLRDPINRAISAINFDCLPKLSQSGQSAFKCCERLARLHEGKSDDRCRKRAELSDYFAGSANSIGQALIGQNQSRKEHAQLLMNSFVHTKMSIHEHVGGVETLKHLVQQNTKFYVVVLDDKSGDFPTQVVEQLKRILSEATRNMDDRIRARKLKLPASYRNIHESFSNYSSTTGAAARGFSNWYAKDYDPIVYLGTIGCGEVPGCMKSIERIVKNRRPEKKA
jgi:hypothetical protein